MSWARILENDAGPAQPLRQRIDVLFAQQREAWSTLRAGTDALANLRTKKLTRGVDSLVVQLNVGRRSSVLAKTDPESIAARDCFLCPESMPPEERGVAFEDLVVLPNPFPCQPLHCTIASLDHRPQQIAGRIPTFLELAQALSPDLAVTYNGPQCGASAPDHFHFQCFLADGLPIFGQLPLVANRAAISLYNHFGRGISVFTGSDVAQVQADVERAVESLGRSTNSNDEPMINLAASFDGEYSTVLLFPRTRHRPGCYFATGPDRLVVSPGVLELCGLFVVTHASDFDRMNADIVRLIYQEVCAPA